MSSLVWVYKVLSYNQPVRSIFIYLDLLVSNYVVSNGSHTPIGPEIAGGATERDSSPHYPGGCC